MEARARHSRECLRRAWARGVQAIGLHTASYLTAATRPYERLGFRRAPEFDIGIGEMFTGRAPPSGESWQALGIDSTCRRSNNEQAVRSCPSW